MTVKLRYIKTKCPLIVEEWGNKKIDPGMIVDGKDLTYADIICKKYPNCFEIIEEVDQEVKEKVTQKDKMLPRKAIEKESF